GVYEAPPHTRLGWLLGCLLWPSCFRRSVWHGIPPPARDASRGTELESVWHSVSAPASDSQDLEPRRDVLPLNSLRHNPSRDELCVRFRKRAATQQEACPGQNWLVHVPFRNLHDSDRNARLDKGWRLGVEYGVRLVPANSGAVRAR